MTPNEQRKSSRYQTSTDVNFSYDFDATLDVHPEEHPPFAIDTYHGRMRNISTEGLCFNSDQKLNQGDVLNLDVYVKGGIQPIHLQGTVCWIKEVPAQESGYHFDTGITITAIEGKPVGQTVRFDQEHGIYWSDVLESMKDRRALGLLVIACIMGVVLYYKYGKILPSGFPSLAFGPVIFVSMAAEKAAPARAYISKRSKARERLAALGGSAPGFRAGRRR